MPIRSISVTPPSPSLVEGQSQQFIATAINNNGTYDDITQSATWRALDPTIATIDANGLATAVSAGAVTISASSGGVTGATTLMVADLALVGIAVAPGAITLEAGQTVQYGAVGTYTDDSQSNLTAEVTWSSSDETIATVDASGFAEAVAGGVAIITATSGALAATAALTVQAATPPQPIPPGPTPPPPGSPADYLQRAQMAMFQLLSGQQPSRVETPQLGAVEFVPTTPAQLQRVIDYLQGLVQAGNVWPTDPSFGSMNAGYTRGRKPFSFYGWP